MTRAELSAKIDHTMLRPDTAPDAVRVLCAEARRLSTASVCVNPVYVPLCRELLEGSPVAVCTVVGFPLGAMESAAKGFETVLAIRAGASEIDMVLAVGALKNGDEDTVRRDIQTVVDGAAGCTVKVILETCLLTDAEIITACRLSGEAGAHFVKTSTGFASSGATVEHVRLMRAHTHLKVKAAGGIRTTAQALSMLEAGADRLGCSATAAILMGLPE